MTRRQCKAIVPETELQCKAQAVAPGTNRTKVVRDPKTGRKKKVTIFKEDGSTYENDPKFCQMHQPSKIKLCKCKCHQEFQTVDEIVSSNVPIQIQLTQDQKNMIKQGNEFFNLTTDQLVVLHNSFGTSKPKRRSKPKPKSKSKSKSKSKTKKSTKKK